jgi:ResB-like family
MATAAKRVPPSSRPPQTSLDRVPAPPVFYRLTSAIDAVYRFMASLKLAVFSILTLAATLGYATFFESWYGTGAAQEYIYRSSGFAVLLAFLGMNILCAALIRYPWKRRQIGFVVTHAGLLTVLVGSLYSVRTGDEGQVGMLEGDVKNELVRSDYPVIRVWEIDPHSRQHTREFDLPFRPGPFGWGTGTPRPASVLGRVLSTVSLGLLGPAPATSEVLTKPGDPFRLEVKEHLPAAAPAIAHVADPEGSPMIRLGLQFKAPGMPRAQDAFRSEEDHWFGVDKKFYRVVRSQPPALLTFAYVDRPELVEDFLKPPSDPGPKGVARLRYRDRSGKNRVFDWPLAGQEGKSVSLPDSDLLVTLSETAAFPTATEGYRMDQMLGEDAIPTAIFKIQSGQGPAITHLALANLPMMPNVIPAADESARKEQGPPLASIHYIVAPTLDPDRNGRFGQIEVLASREDALYYRVFGRGKERKAELRAAGPLAPGKPIVAFGGSANMPMTISFQVDEYLPAANEKQIYEPVILPKAQMGNGIAACRAEMTVDGQTKEVWLSRSENLDPPAARTVAFGDSVYQLTYDVDRKPLGFEIKLDDFDMGFEPGTEQATHFESKVRLSDASEGIKDQPHLIWMNHPLDHRGYTFYQSNYIRVRDPHTRQFTGQFQSVFQVASNPGRPVIYSGCLLVVLGTFLQFYMRAGIFTDGGKRERELAAAKARKKLQARAMADEVEL